LLLNHRKKIKFFLWGSTFQRIGTSVEKVINHSVQLHPTAGSKKTSLSLEVLQELDKHYSTNVAPWIFDDSTTLPGV
jgi:hypothetical protein